MCDGSIICAVAQSCAEIESPPARAPSAAGREFSPATVLRADAQAEYSMHFRPAYGPHRSRTGAPRRTSSTKFPAPCNARRRNAELPITVTSVTGARRRVFVDSSLTRTRTVPRSD